MDESDLPMEWRRQPPDEAAIAEVASDWAVFVRYCEERGLVALPASQDTVLAFLRDPPVVGPRLFAIWTAIDRQHDSIYWHIDANAVLRLETYSFVHVRTDGTIDWAPERH